MSKKAKPFNDAFSGLKLPPKEPPRAPAAPPVAKAPPPKKRAETADEEEHRLFLESIGDVAPVRAGKSTVAPPTPPKADQLRIQTEESEAMTRLAELVSGTGSFDIADTDEFVEGRVPGFDERVMRRLRAGQFSVQAHIDLHGLSRDDAFTAVNAFLTKSKLAGHRCVLIVTGRGLHSKDNIPVLKESVRDWLSRGRSAREVLAFCSARQQDGGLGAVYVLLRR